MKRLKSMKQRLAVLIAMISMIACGYFYELPACAANVGDEGEAISYYVHQQTYGNSATVTGGTTAGRTGSGKRLEAFSIARTSNGVQGDIQYRAHCQTFGWMDWKKSGQLAGTSGMSKRMEAVQIQLTGDLAAQYDIYYRTYMSNCGWFDWAKNGEISGTTGYGATLEAIQIMLVKKGAANAPQTGRYINLTPDNMNTIYYSGHVQTYGNTSTVTNGAVLGTTGKSKRMEAIKINLSHGTNQVFGSLTYNVHCQTYGWLNNNREGTIAGTSGQAKRMEAISISLTGDLATYCDIYYRVHVQRYGWLGWAKNGANAGTSNNSLRMEAIQIKILPKGSAAPGSTARSYIGAKVVSNTSGYQMLEPYLDRILAEHTNNAMSKVQKLRACYDYIRTSFPYRTLSNTCPPNFKWYEHYAYQIASTGSGNCYGFNYLLGELALKIGYTNVHFYKGSIQEGHYPHGWVTIDGLIYDPEIQFKSPSRNMFGVTNGNPYPYFIDMVD